MCYQTVLLIDFHQCMVTFLWLKSDSQMFTYGIFLHVFLFVNGTKCIMWVELVCLCSSSNAWASSCFSLCNGILGCECLKYFSKLKSHAACCATGLTGEGRVCCLFKVKIVWWEVNRETKRRLNVCTERDTSLHCHWKGCIEAKHLVYLTSHQT